MLKIKLALLALLSFCAGSFAQVFNPSIYTEHHVVFLDSSAQLYYAYKIPHNLLVFEKSVQGYFARCRLMLEASDSLSKYVKREIVDKKINVKTFEETNSAEISTEGLLKLEIPLGKYEFKPFFTDFNANKELDLPPFKVNVLFSDTTLFLNPIICNDPLGVCNEDSLFVLTNFESNIPFSDQNYQMIIPAVDTSLASISMVILSGKDTVCTAAASKAFKGNIRFDECVQKIFLNKFESARSTKNFIFNNFSALLPEGSYTIILNDGITERNKYYELKVNWYNKPISLRNPDFAVKILKNIEPEAEIKSLQRAKNEKQYKALFNFWKRYDPTPNTQFNELMNEYYLRADYAVKNFNTINGKNGAETDRGKIYMKFGKPDDITRTPNVGGKMLETWIYNEKSFKFVFIDKTGLGEFKLLENNK